MAFLFLAQVSSKNVIKIKKDSFSDNAGTTMVLKRVSMYFSKKGEKVINSPNPNFKNKNTMQKNVLFYVSALCFFLSLFVYDPAAAQRRRKYKDKPPKIMKNLPQFFADDSKLPDYLKNIYKRDASRIAIRLLNQELRLSKQTVKIPEELVQAVYNALVVVRTSDYNAVNKIANTYNIRTFPVPNVESIILVFQHDDDRLASLRRSHGGSLDDPELSELLREYNLHIRKLVYLDEERAGMVVQAEAPINVPALAYRFFLQEGIGSIEEVMPYGDGNDISMARTRDGWDLTYSVRFGNCVNQCQKRHDWKFSVSEEGDVAYHGEEGHVIPPWVTPAAHLPKDILKK